VINDGPAPSSWTGRAEMAEGWRSFLSTWEEFRVEVDEYRELDGERVLVLDHPSGRARRAGSSSDRCRQKERSCSTSATAR
jgi:hypothetical protein